MTGWMVPTTICVTKTLAPCLLFGALAACTGNDNVATTTISDAAHTPVYVIQGDGAESPPVGQTVTVSGVVTGDFQDSPSESRLGGFYMQAEIPDGNLLTSDGVFVFDGPAPQTEVGEGNVVRVRGLVTERFGETQIVADAVSVTGSGSILPVDITLPADRAVQNSDGESIADFERFEGMLVRVQGSLTVTELYDLERFGELLLSADGRLMHFTNSEPPDVRGYAEQRQDHLLRSLRLDDGSSRRNITPSRYLFPASMPGTSLRVGDSVSYLVGNIRFSRGSGGSGSEAYRLVPMDEPLFVALNPRPEGTPEPGGTLKIASFNMLNFFSGLDRGDDICGPGGDSNCRGANSAEEFARQLGKTVSALTILDADVVGLIELENSGNVAIRTVVAALNESSGSNMWSYIDTGNIGDDAIRNGFIYNSATVTPLGVHAIIDSATDARFLDRKNRPSVAQTFRHNASGGALTVVVNHLKSKGSSCDASGDPDLGDGQANCSKTRSAATAAIVDWLARDPTNSGDGDFLIIGDLNAYLREDPVAAIETSAYTNLLRMFSGPDAYSYVFRGESGALDHALASPSLAPQVRGALEWHINADEPALLDYNLEFGRDAALFDAASPFRTSDHDPVVIGLELQ